MENHKSIFLPIKIGSMVLCKKGMRIHQVAISAELFVLCIIGRFVWDHLLMLHNLEKPREAADEKQRH